MAYISKVAAGNATYDIKDAEARDALAGKYAKPTGGIPKSDLASAVQTSLGKADSALQSIPSDMLWQKPGVQASAIDDGWYLWTADAPDGDDNKVVISSLIAGAGIAKQSWVQSQGYLTEHQSLANYYTKSQVDALLPTVTRM